MRFWTAIALVVIAALVVILLLGCGREGDVDQARQKCERDGGVFVEKSGYKWECRYE